MILVSDHTYPPPQRSYLYSASSAASSSSYHQQQRQQTALAQQPRLNLAFSGIGCCRPAAFRAFPGSTLSPAAALHSTWTLVLVKFGAARWLALSGWENSEFDSGLGLLVRNLHVFSLPARVFSRYSDFLPQAQNMQIQLIEDSKLPLWECVSEWIVCVSCDGLARVYSTGDWSVVSRRWTDECWQCVDNLLYERLSSLTIMLHFHVAVDNKRLLLATTAPSCD